MWKHLSAEKGKFLSNIMTSIKSSQGPICKLETSSSLELTKTSCVQWMNNICIFISMREYSWYDIVLWLRHKWLLQLYYLCLKTCQCKANPTSSITQQTPLILLHYKATRGQQRSTWQKVTPVYLLLWFYSHSSHRQHWAAEQLTSCLTFSRSLAEWCSVCFLYKKKRNCNQDIAFFVSTWIR